MKKYFFVSFKAINGTRTVGGGGLVVGCSCGFDKMEEHLLNYYNGRAINEANDICITSLSVLDKQTASQLSNNFTDGALIIDDGDNDEEKQIEDVTLEVVEDKTKSCAACFFDENEDYDCDVLSTARELGLCTRLGRKDNMNVIFKKVE